ncbi:MAG TPA: NAD(P)-dependent oxidoreductase [Solirubrobacteraceae bacterium]|jgi:nucleoside-diphosphate-sugar epimerase|nr:NAD(P)-dependent oxidoreductase [Solirubrobacteraceae bacterium]
MRVFLAGATGVIGRRLLPLLLAEGHEVTGMTRSTSRVEQLRAAGAEAVVADAFDAEALKSAVAQARPEAVIHQLTSIPRRIDPRKMERDFETNDRLRTEGTANLMAAARAAGVSRIVVQSVAFFYAPGPPGTVHGEQDELLREAQAPKPVKRSAEALVSLERTTLQAGGTVLRNGYFYGPGSAIAGDGSTGEEVARGRLPIVGSGAGVWSFIHVDDAAAATVAALNAYKPGVFNIVDDEPARVADWIPALAASLGARKPRKVPVLLARVLAGSYGVALMTQAQGASNALAKRELGWQPRYPSWREGFVDGLG